MAVKEQLITDDFALYNADCIEMMKSMPNESIHLSIYSPPFGGLYHYSSDIRDLSNSTDYNDFLNHYEYVVSELLRLTPPGRITAVHCADITSGNSGNDYLIDLPGDIVKLHEKIGWRFAARHTIWKEPLWVRNRTLAKSLFHSTVCEDSAYAGVASADFLLIFRKRGTNKIPIAHPTGLEFYAGENKISDEFLEYKNHVGDQTENRWSHNIWRRYASSVWDDIDMSRLLPFQESKDEDDEMHLHPLQLDVIDRCIMLRSNPGENIFTPFMGVGSEVYGAVIAGRKGIGVELKPSYYRQAVKNMELAKMDRTYKSVEQMDVFKQDAV